MSDRLDRALSQRMYLLGATHTGDRSWEFHIEGSRGVPYKVFMGPNRSTCTCPDYTRRRTACKHIIFISLRVLRLTSYSTVVTPDMDAALSRLLERMTNPVVAEEKPESEEPKSGEDDKELEGESCPICFEDLDVKSQCDKCRQCRKYIHKACIAVWLKQKPNCPLCRAPWRNSGGVGGGARAGVIGAGEADDALNKFSFNTSVRDAPPPSPGVVERITASIAKKQYKLTEQDLHTLDYTPVTNPVYPGGAPMRLFLVSDVKRLAEEKLQAASNEQRAEREKKEKKAREKQEKERAKQEKERLKQEKKAAKEAAKAAKEAAKEAKRAEKDAAKQQKEASKKAKAKIEEAPESTPSDSNEAAPRRSSRAARPKIVVTEAESDEVQPRTKRARRA